MEEEQRRRCNFLTCQSYCYRPPLRHLIAIMGLFYIIVMYSHRQVFGVAIVSMVDSPDTINKECKADNEEEQSGIKGGKYKWDESVQSVLLAMFYIGYVPFQFMYGFLCDWYGARRIMIISMAISAAITFLLPTFVHYTHWGFTAAIRLLNGIVQGVTYPGVASLLNNWILPSEFGKFGGVIFGGFAMGTIIGNFVTTKIIEATKNWEYIFYIWGSITIVYLIFFGLYVYSTPYSHPNISLEEKELIDQNQIRTIKHKLSWRILKDPSFYGLILGQLGINFSLFALVANFPKYCDNVLRMSLKWNAIASSVPYIAIYFSAILFGYVTDFLQVKYNINKGLLRKFCTFFGCFVSSALFVIAFYGRCNRIFVMSLITVAYVFNGFCFCGVEVHCIEVTRNHGSFMMSVGNGIGSAAGIICPLLIGHIADKNTIDQWIKYAWCIFGLTVSLTLLYTLMTSGKRRPWDYTAEELEELKGKPPRQVKWYHERTPEELEKLRNISKTVAK